MDKTSIETFLLGCLVILIVTIIWFGLSLLLAPMRTSPV